MLLGLLVNFVLQNTDSFLKKITKKIDKFEKKNLFFSFIMLYHSSRDYLKKHYKRKNLTNFALRTKKNRKYEKNGFSAGEFCDDEQTTFLMLQKMSLFNYATAN